MSTEYSTGTGATTIDPSKVNLTEADIEEYLWQNPEAVQFGRGWEIKHWIKRQYKVPSGIIDLLGISSIGWPTVVEVKNVPIDAKAITQVSRYAFDVDSIMGELEDYKGVTGKVIVAPVVGSQEFRECEACGISVVTFSVSLSLSTGPLSWKSEFLSQRRQAYFDLANDTELGFGGLFSIPGDIPDEYSDIILGDSEDSVADAVEDYLEQTAGEDGNEAAK